MNENQKPQKILWYQIKASIQQMLRAKNLKSPQLRLAAIENIEPLFRKHFENEYRNPPELLKIDKDEFKRKLGLFRGKILNDAESSIVNNIYEYIKVNIPSDETVIESKNSVVEISDESLPEEKIVNEDNDLNSKHTVDFNKFENELKILKGLFSKKIIEDNLERINEIFTKSESFWGQQLFNLPAEGVKYLLIAEAPPWSAEGEVTYVYNPKSEIRTLLKALYKAFSIDGYANEERLNNLTNEGLLIVDSLPFAMDYSSGGKRSRDKYQELVRECVKTNMLPKINYSKLRWSEDLKIGFAFKRNALSIMSALNNKIEIDSIKKSFSLSEEMIVANNAGYPDAKLIKKVFFG